MVSSDHRDKNTSWLDGMWTSCQLGRSDPRIPYTRHGATWCGVRPKLFSNPGVKRTNGFAFGMWGFPGFGYPSEFNIDTAILVVGGCNCASACLALCDGNIRKLSALTPESVIGAHSVRSSMANCLYCRCTSKPFKRETRNCLRYPGLNTSRCITDVKQRLRQLQS